MNINAAFGKALRRLRKARGLPQEAFGLVSSRTYLSTLERGLKSPTLEKIDSLASVLGIHPLTLLTLTYQTIQAPQDHQKLTERITQEIADLEDESA